MNDAEVVATVLRRWATETRDYWCVGDDFVTLDGKVTVSADEAAAFRRVMGAETGHEWWDRAGEARR